MTAILVDGLSKRYRIGLSERRFPTLREGLAHMARAPFRRRQAEDASLWALRDISFDIRQGEVTGVIGRNGAGKSTLLKILSRITEPTTGFAEIHGRVGSLLEVGTGFHPELTGRENIYLNGAILGMKRVEIERKFDEIVAFAEIEKFLDTVVKHYSTGMFMRLAFAVAAHLDPEILLVDEVLAVGDAEFQKKCLGKMSGVARQGRTVLFVSHNMPAVQSLCSRALVLQSGRLQFAGGVQEGVSLYLAGNQPVDLESQSGDVVIQNLRVNGSMTPELVPTAPIRFEFDLALRRDVAGFRLILVVENAAGTTILHAVRTDRDLPDIRRTGNYSLSLTTPPLCLTAGAYSYYVKFIWSGLNVKGRYVSDKAVLTFRDNYCPEMAPGVLTPVTSWGVGPCHPHPPGAAT